MAFHPGCLHGLIEIVQYNDQPLDESQNCYRRIVLYVRIKKKGHYFVPVEFDATTSAEHGRIRMSSGQNPARSVSNVNIITFRANAKPESFSQQNGILWG